MAIASDDDPNASPPAAEGLAPCPPGLPPRRRALRGFAALAAAAGLAPGTGHPRPAPVASERAAFRVDTLAGGLEHPWSLAFLPGGRMLVTERPGRLRLLDASGRLDPRPIEGLPPVAAFGQGGLLDVLPHPAFADNGWIYLAMVTGPSGSVGTDLVRARLSGHRLVDLQTLFSMQPRSGRGLHFGGRLAFDRAGWIHLSLGDRGDMGRAQRPDDDAGGVIRLHEDGRIPGDNPFVGRAGARSGRLTLGNRNIQGLALHPRTGLLWMHEHGPQGGDEVNIVRAGRNYGWPIVTRGVNYVTGTRIGEAASRPDMEDPIHVWTPSIAPSGMAFCTGSAFPGWSGNLLVGALRGEALHRLELDGDRVVREERLLHRAVGRIRDVRVDREGLVYLLTDAADGRLLRLSPMSRSS